MFAHAQAPCRVGIAGGGTDLPAWTRERVGRCLSLAVDMRAHAVAITRRDRRVVASYRQRDDAAMATEIANGIIRETALLHEWLDGFEVHTISEVTSIGSGLGVSSAIAVALAACFDKLSALRDGPRVDSEEEMRAVISCAAWTVEINRLRRPIGRQDHMAATYGGLRVYRFEDDDAKIERSFDDDAARWVAEHVALIQLPDGHDARAILSAVDRRAQLEDAIAAVPVAERAVEDRDPEMLGKALDLGYKSKETIPGAVTSAVRAAVTTARRVPGVHGAKVAGAGGGGHIVVACDRAVDEELCHVVGLPVTRVAPDLTGVRSSGMA